MTTPVYIGRFAPTPSGPLHFGSLIAALGSYLDARAHNGQWLVRIEDIDTQRSRQEYIKHQLTTLDIHGLYHDKTIRRQSLYPQDYLDTLKKLTPHLYPCRCSRKTHRQHARGFGALGAIYPGFCRQRLLTTLNPQDCAVRLRLPGEKIAFQDRLLGRCVYHLQDDIGDPVLRRRDGDFAYALAVVTDDALQNVTHIIRGQDLTAATAIHRYIQDLLSFPVPQYLHLPLVRCPDGSKYSKQNHAPALNPMTPGENIIAALNFLGQNTQGFHAGQSAQSIVTEAIKRWNIGLIPQKVK